MADYINDRLDPPANSILTDSSVTYGVVLLSGRPDLFVDRADLDEGEWLEIRSRPFGEVDYMLVAADEADLIGSTYPGIELGAVPGLTPIFHTDRYVLLQVDREAGQPGEVVRPARVTSQPRLVTPRAPLTPPSARPSAPLDEAGLSPMPAEAGAPGADDGALSSAPEVAGE